LIRFRWQVLFLFIAVTACAAYFAQQIQFDFSPEALITNEDTTLVRQSHENFGKETRFVIVALQAQGAHDVFSPEALNWQYQTSVRLSKLEGTYKLKGLATIRLPEKVLVGKPRNLWLFGTKEHNLKSANAVRTKVEEIKQLRGPFVSDDMRCAGILAFLKDEVKKITEIKGVTDAIEKMLSDHPCPDGYEAHLTGIPYLRVKIVDHLKADQKFLIPIAGCFLGIVIALLFRCLGAVVLPPIALGCGVVWTVAVLVITNNPINIITNVLPVILLVIGSSNCVHILNRYAEESRYGLSTSEAMRETLNHMIPACLLASITTAIGFLSLVYSGSTILQGFGWQFISAVEHLCLCSAKNPKLILICAMVPMVVVGFLSMGLFGFKGVEVQAYLADTLQKSNPEVKSLAVVEDQLGGLSPIEVILRAQEPGQLTKIDVMNRVRRVIDDVRSARRLQRIEEQLLKKRNTSGLSLFLTADQKEARLLINLKDTGTIRGREIVEDLERLLAKEFPSSGPVQFELTGEMYVGLYALDNFVNELLVSLFMATVIIIFVLALFFRSVTLGLVSVVPNITPLIVTLGYMGIRGYDLNVANVTVFAIGLGIAVDDTIHFLSRYRDEFSADGKVLSAISRTARGSGTAIVLTTILIIGGMAVLLSSSFIPTKRFAELTIVTMMAALAGDLLMLPAIIGLVSRDRTPNQLTRVAELER